MPIDNTEDRHTEDRHTEDRHKNPVSDALLIMGLMAGTSVDGIDAALVYSDGERIQRTGHGLTTAYEPATRAAIFRAFDTPYAHDDDLAERIARDHARAAEMLMAQSGMMPDIISFHGQTIYHAPAHGISLQIGDAGYLTKRLGLPVVHQFRQQDLAHSGQGAPLAPIYHQALIQAMGIELPGAVVNIGGISNASIWDGDNLIGLDLGPGNALMDELAQQHLAAPYDVNGALAGQGRADMALVKAAMDHEFFAVKGPKSLDRGGLHDIVPMAALAALTPADQMASYLAITAASIVRGIRLNAPDVTAIVICGGGSFNPVLMAAIKAHAAPMRVSRMDDFMLDGLALDSRFIEAELMAYLAARSYHGLPITFPNTTGVKAPQSGGVWVRLAPK